MSFFFIGPSEGIWSLLRRPVEIKGTEFHFILFGGLQIGCSAVQSHALLLWLKLVMRFSMDQTQQELDLSQYISEQFVCSHVLFLNITKEDQFFSLMSCLNILFKVSSQLEDQEFGPYAPHYNQASSSHWVHHFSQVINVVNWLVQHHLCNLNPSKCLLQGRDLLFQSLLSNS